MIEKIHRFGKDQCLLGVTTNPTVIQEPAVILLNAGLIHRTGPYRMHTDLARQLAAIGFTVLRFDLSGIGDSLMRKDDRSHEARTMADIQDAVDFLSASTGIKKFVLIGLCTGADNAHKYSVLDKRISGAVFLDGYGYPTLRFYLQRIFRYFLKVFTISRYQFYFSQLFKIFSATIKSSTSEKDRREDVFFWEMPSKAKVEKELQVLVGRDVNLFYIYSGGQQSFYYNYRNQFFDMFKQIDFKGKILVEYFKDADHTYTLLEDREKLIRSICNWMNNKYQSEV